MLALSFYRFYASITAGVLTYILFSRSLWSGLLSALAVRLAWFGVERSIAAIFIKRHYERHVYEFKQQLGPYGIRLANMAQRDWTVKKSLDEVFTSNVKKLQQNVDQLRALDTLFSAGMRPDAQTYQLHDCKLKYGTYRLEKIRKTQTPT
jgi:hypothetical protein